MAHVGEILAELHNDRELSQKDWGVCFILGEVRYPAMSGVAAFQIQTESHRSQIIFM